VLRRAMGKKKPAEMAKQRAIFVEGCAKKNDIPSEKANQLFDVLDKFAGYGFNKAHAACYGVITCQTAWLKARHPVEFMAALLSNELDNTDKIALFVAEARAMGIAVLAPSVNASGSLFTVGEKSIRFGLSAIKNVGQAAVELIIAARTKDGPFRDLHDLCSRVESRGMNKKLVESLVKSGACDDFGQNRAELLTQIDGALAQATAKARDRDAGQASLLDLLGPMEPAAKKSNASAKANGVPDFPPRERLGYEKELLGFYITGHPLDDYVADLAAFQTHTVAQLREVTGEVDARLCGIITKLEVRLSQKDKTPWARVVLEDLTGSIEALIFQPLYGDLPRPLDVGEIVVISGSLDRWYCICRWRIGSIPRAGRSCANSSWTRPGRSSCVSSARAPSAAGSVPASSLRPPTIMASHGLPHSRRVWKPFSAARATSCAPRPRSRGRSEKCGNSGFRPIPINVATIMDRRRSQNFATASISASSAVGLTTATLRRSSWISNAAAARTSSGVTASICRISLSGLITRL
jgi:hypothetical protein